MPPTRDNGLTSRSIILWVGPKHSGKTRSAGRLVEAACGRGFFVAGCLAPSVYADHVLLGFDLVDLRSGRRAPLARRNTGQGQDRSFHFLAEGLSLGDEALSPAATREADLIMVDEYGPRELKSQLWRRATDRLVVSTDAVLLLIVREELVDAVLRLYAGPATRTLSALASESVGEVLSLLDSRRRLA